MKVCSVIDTLQYGGAEAQLLEITRRAEFDHLVCFRLGSGDRRVEFKRAGATVVGLDFDWQYDTGGIVRLRENLRDCDVIHGHLPASISIARLAGMAVGAPVVSTHHNVPSTYGIVSRSLERLTRPIDRETVAVSNGVKTAHDGQNWRVIYNGIDVESFRQGVSDADSAGLRKRFKTDESLTLLNVARYAPQKSQEDLIAMIPKITELINDVQLILVGHGPLEKELRQIVSNYGVDSQVTVTGHVPDVKPFYGIADLFVSSSTQEGLPITFLEAMAAELPIIATNIPGVREVVVDGETGELVPPADPERLAKAVSRVFDVRQQYGRAAYDRANNEFHIDNTVQEYVDLYSELA